MCDKSLHAIVKHLKSIKNHVLENDFDSQEAEIYFFRHIKPKFTSKLIYVKKVRKIETRKPIGSKEKQIKYLKRELNKLNIHFNDNQYFYNYIRSRDRLLDDKILISNK